MSEQTTPGPVFGDSAGSDDAAGSAEASAPVVPESSGSPEAPVSITRDMLLAAIPEEIRNESVFQNINAENPIADMAGQFLNAQKLVGVEKIPAPKEDWTEEQWAGLYDRIGRPKDLSGYKEPDAESLALDEKALGEFKSLAHKSGLTTKQFEAVIDFHNRYYGTMQEQAQQQTDEQLQAGLNELKQEWGDQYQQNLEIAGQFFLNEIKDESLRTLITENKALRNHPGVIRHFLQLARDAQEGAMRVGDRTNPSIIRSAEQAQAALKQYEADNREILFSRRESLSPVDRQRLDEVIERRTKLYKMAFPE